MGLLKLFPHSKPGLQRLPSGSMTVDNDGQVLTSTLPSTCPPQLVREIGLSVLRLLREAREAQLPLPELSIHFSSLLIVAREIRGGAIIFVRPRI